MKVIKNINRISLTLIGLSFILAGWLTGCGSSGGVSGGSIQTGKVAILLTDGPTDEFSQVNVTVNEVSLLSDEQGPVILFSGSRRINLLALQEVEDLFTVNEDVPAGSYGKIRLSVSEPEFVKRDGEIIPSSQIHLVANGKIDLVPDHPIQVVPGEPLIVRLDCDAEKSIFIHISNPKDPVYQFRPVIFVEIQNDTDTRLASVRGDIVSIDPETQSFLLQRTFPIFYLSKMGNGTDHAHEADNENSDDSDSLSRQYLIRVDVTEETHIFEASGQPGDFDSLIVGQEVHVRGRLSFEDDLHLKAGLIEIGQFLRLRGVISTGLDEAKRFGFTPDPGQEVSGELTVQVYDETLLFKAGTHERLTPEDLVAGKQVLIEGVLEVGSEPALFHTALIVVRPPESDLTHLKGTLSAPDPISRTFLLSQDCPTDIACATVLTTVHVMSDAVILRITSKESTGEDNVLGINMIPFEALTEGAQVSVFGQFDSSGTPFHANVVVVDESS